MRASCTSGRIFFVCSASGGCALGRIPRISLRLRRPWCYVQFEADLFFEGYLKTDQVLLCTRLASHSHFRRSISVSLALLFLRGAPQARKSTKRLLTRPFHRGVRNSSTKVHTITKIICGWWSTTSKSTLRRGGLWSVTKTNTHSALLFLSSLSLKQYGRHALSVAALLREYSFACTKQLGFKHSSHKLLTWLLKL